MAVTNNSSDIHPLVNTVIIGTGIAFSNLGYSTTPTASNLSERDSNANLSANSFIASYTTTATAAGTTTLTVSSTEQQYFTGTNTQTVILPVTSTLVLGQSYTIVNNSTGNVTVESSGGNVLQVMVAGTQLIATVILTTGTTTASWSWFYYTNFISITTVAVAASPYTVLVKDQYLACSPTTGAITIKLPNAPTQGRVIIIKDTSGSAATHNISVTTVGGTVTIDGQTTYTMVSNYSSIQVIFDGTNYQIF